MTTHPDALRDAAQAAADALAAVLAEVVTDSTPARKAARHARDNLRQALYRAAMAQTAPEAQPLWLYIALCDLVDEAGALGTVMERPEVLRRKLATLRDAVGAAPVAQTAPAVAQQGGEPDAQKPKSLDDPRLQELFGWAIDGAMAQGAADECPPPAGHWLTAWWERGRALAAQAAAAHAQQPAQPAALTDEALWRKAVQEAYGWLWHVNNEPMAPIPMWPPERAAYEARKCLRDLLTTAERGEAINVISAHMDKMAATPAPTTDTGEQL